MSRLVNERQAPAEIILELAQIGARGAGNLDFQGIVAQGFVCSESLSGGTGRCTFPINYLRGTSGICAQDCALGNLERRSFFNSSSPAAGPHGGTPVNLGPPFHLGEVSSPRLCRHRSCVAPGLDLRV